MSNLMGHISIGGGGVMVVCIFTKEGIFSVFAARSNSHSVGIALWEKGPEWRDANTGQLLCKWLLYVGYSPYYQEPVSMLQGVHPCHPLLLKFQAMTELTS